MGKCDFAMVIEDFSEEYFTHCLLRNLRSLQMYKHADLHPKAVLLGGQSGAGKTTIHVIKQKEFNCNIIILDADSYRTQNTLIIASCLINTVKKVLNIRVLFQQKW